MAFKEREPAGYWVLIDENGQETNFFTKNYVETYIEESTGRKYKRGRFILFFQVDGKPDFPPLIEDTGGFKFIVGKPEKKEKPLTTAEEIYINQI
ncbi:MAG TPA: hypothetical protein VFD05_02220 [Bacilli bacterium]|nr:hypothetical protein [Bacilli bacterium]